MFHLYAGGWILICTGTEIYHVLRRKESKILRIRIDVVKTVPSLFQED